MEENNKSKVNEEVSKKKDTEKKKSISKQKRKGNHPFHSTEVVFLVVLTVVISVLMTYICTISFQVKNQKTNTNTQVDSELQEFIDNYHHIVDNYYEEVDKKELIDNAIQGMISSLDDPYATYFDKTNSSNFDATLAGTYSGVGLEVYNDENMNVIVSRVFENSSAAKAGIQEGDMIRKVDKIDLTGKKTSEFSNYIKDANKKSYEVIYVHDGVEKIATLKKSLIIIQSVSSRVIEKDGKKLGYITIDIFSATTYNQFKKAVEKLEAEHVDGMMIDVRDNTGGHLTVVSDMLSLFLSKKHVIYQIEDKEKKTKYYSTGKKTKKYPVAIIQNGASASASELFTAAMKEEYGAKVVGTKSYGKGTVQELNTLTDGTQYKFTTKKWLTPKGNWVHKNGIEPDYQEELNETYYENRSDESDNQLQKAISVLLETVNVR